MGAGELLRAPQIVCGRRQVLASVAQHKSSVTRRTKCFQVPMTSSQVADRDDALTILRISAQKGPSLATSAVVSPRKQHPGEKNGVRHREVSVPCSESGLAETVSDSSVIFDSIGSDSLPVSPSSLTGPSERSPGNYYTEAGIEVVKSLEEAENELLKTVSGKDHGVFPIRNPGFEKNPSGLSAESPSSDAESNAFQIEGQLMSPQAALEMKLAEEQHVARQAHLLKTLQEPVVAAAVMVTEVAGALIGTKEDKLVAPLKNMAVDEQVLDKESMQPVEMTVKGKNMLEQLREIILFAGPALGIWMSGPLMSLIDTAVIGNSSSLELAALGPGTVLCDQMCYVFMFLSVATSNLIATSLAQQDEAEAARHLSRLLFVSLACGVAMLLFTEFGATSLLQAFVGARNAGMVPAARTYVQIRALAWPAILVGMVAQSASLGMQDSWTPLKVLAIASLINLSGDILLCTVLGYGIAGAAWATMASQYVTGFLMLQSLNGKGYNALAMTAPSLKELAHMVELAAPVLLTMLSKVMFYTLITYLATSLGAVTLAAHQVMIGIYSLCTVCGEPLAQTAQSFMPALIHGSQRNLKQAHMLLRSLMLMGAMVGLTLGCMAISIPWVFPQIFTGDPAIISQMRMVTVPFLCSLMITPPTLSLEGTLLAGRDLKFLGFSMASCFCGGSVLLLMFNRLGFGLYGSWWTLAVFQWTRFMQSYFRLASPQSFLADPDTDSAFHLKVA